MSKPFSVLGSLVLLLLGIAQGVWLWKAVNVTVGDLSMPIWVPIGGLAIALLTSFGIAFEAMRGARARQAQLPVPADDAVSRDIQRKPSKFTVKQGRRYKARIELGFFEQVASNSMIADKFQEVGFSDVSVTGDGSEREAIGRWNGQDTTAQLPSQAAWGLVTGPCV